MDRNEDVDGVKVYQSEHKSETIEPLWLIKELRIQTLCNSDQNMPIIFEVWNYKDDGEHELYGAVQTSLADILGSQSKEFELTTEEEEIVGSLHFTQFLVIEKPSMMDYLRSGWAISLSVAIDFTASNGELFEPGSLHYINPGNPQAMTQYEQAIHYVGSILEPYDSNRQFPVFGFGAIPRYMGSNQVSHCFNLNGSENPEVIGVGGILAAYRSALQNGIGLNGPTNFAPCLKTMMHYIKTRLHIAEYSIMLYITDGAITDLQDTINAIVEASNLPMSIIIVGVGEANFSKMEALDCDKHKLTNAFGQASTRDIVQFVEFNDFMNDLTLLPEAVLKEVPNQLVSYMQANRIKAVPSDHIPASDVIYM